MIDVESFAPELLGFWPQKHVYGGHAASALDEAGTRAAIEEYFLETKSGSPAPAEELRVLLNDMTAEMREQFVAFRDLRKAAERAAAGTGDDAAAKLARADLKAATDAMSLIVRTLEKIDQLQRQFARDREQAAEEGQAAIGLDDAKARFLDLVEQRAEERARQLLADWQRDGAPAAGHDAAARATEEAEPG